VLILDGSANTNSVLQLEQVTTTNVLPSGEWDIVFLNGFQFTQIVPVSNTAPALRTYVTGGSSGFNVYMEAEGSATYVYGAGTTLTTISSRYNLAKSAGVFDGATVVTISMGADGDTVLVYSSTVTTVNLGAAGTTAATQDYLWVRDSTILSGGIALGNNWKQAVIENTDLNSLSGGNNVQVVFLTNVVITGSITGMGSGVDRIYATGLTMTSPTSVIDMESDDDFVFMRDSTFGGHINMGSGAGEVIIESSTLTFNGFVFILGAKDTVELYNVNAPLADVFTSYDDDTIRVQGSTLRSIISGSGNDQVYLTTSTVETILLESGDDTLYMFSGSVQSISLGSNNDEVRITQNSRAGATLDCGTNTNGVFLTTMCGLDITLAANCPAPQPLVSANCCI